MRTDAELAAEDDARERAALVASFQTCRIDGWTVPATLRDGLVRYVVDRVATGGFLRAVLENDLSGALARLDRGVPIEDLRAITGWIYNEAPSPCWGSPAKVAAWLAGTEA